MFPTLECTGVERHLLRAPHERRGRPAHRQLCDGRYRATWITVSFPLTQRRQPRRRRSRSNDGFERIVV